MYKLDVIHKPDVQTTRKQNVLFQTELFSVSTFMNMQNICWSSQSVKYWEEDRQKYNVSYLTRLLDAVFASLFLKVGVNWHSKKYEFAHDWSHRLLLKT